MEEDTLTLEGLGTTVRVDGRKGKNIIREYDSGTTIKLQRALRDVKQQLPKTAVSFPSSLNLSMPSKAVQAF